MKDINHGDNDNNELILLEDGVITESSDDDNEEESSGEEEDNNDKKKGSSYEEKGNNDEEEGNNNEDDCNNDKEEHNYDEEKGDGNEEKAIHQIVKALDEDKISSCNGEFAPYLDNYTTTTLFCWLQKHNVSTKAYEDLVDIIHNPQFEPTHSGNFVYYHDNGLQKLGKLKAILKDGNGNYELQVQLILNYDELPENLKGLSRRRRSLTGEV
ncbi:unnamed protein product [Rhizophagus irregularis]|nr:unnamed protein product [Rhizophagus irregularis]